MLSKDRLTGFVMVVAILFLIGTMMAPVVTGTEDPSDPDHVDDEHADEEEHAEEDAPPEIPGFGIIGAIVPIAAIAYFLKKR